MRTTTTESYPRHRTLMQWLLLMLVLVALVLGTLLSVVACAPTAALNALASGSTHTRITDVSYGPLPRQKLDVYRPNGQAPAGGWPVVVFFYGGSWNSGERAQYAFVGEALASRGVLALLADYRLYPEVRYPRFLEDSALALAHGLQHAAIWGGNPRRVYVMGHSAGAYNAAMLALDPRWLAATGRAPAELAGFIGLAGPYEFLPMTNVAAQPVFFHPNYPPGTQPVDHASAHASKQAGQAAAPRTFLGAAASDPLVDPERNSAALAALLRAAGTDVTLRRYERVNHLTLIGVFAQPLRWLAPVLDDVAVFINGG